MMLMAGVRFIAILVRVEVLRYEPFCVHPFRGVHKDNLFRYVAIFEAGTNAKHISPHLIRRLCFNPRLHTGFI